MTQFQTELKSAVQYDLPTWVLPTWVTLGVSVLIVVALRASPWTAVGISVLGRLVLMFPASSALGGCGLGQSLLEQTMTNFSKLWQTLAETASFKQVMCTGCTHM